MITIPDNIDSKYRFVILSALRARQIQSGSVPMVTDRDAGRAAGLARDISEFLDGLRSNSVRILGPAPAPLERIKRVHRHQLLIKSSSRGTLHGLLERLQRYIEERKIGPTAVIIDVDPVSLM